MGPLIVAAMLAAPALVTAQQKDSSSGKTSAESSSDESSALSSDPTGVVLWLFRDGEISPERTSAFRGALRKALSDSSRRHLLSRDDFRSYLEGRSAGIPRCMRGLEPCISPKTLVFDELDLNSVVRVRLRSDGKSVRVEYRLIDRRGAVAETSELSGDDPESLAFSVVRELFDATGSVAIRSTPSGAAVRIDGKTVGTTPLETRLPVGRHTFTLQHQNRQSEEGTFELSSGGEVVVERKLPKQPGELLVKNAPDGAAVYIDGKERGASGSSIELKPGTYQIAVRADGYEDYEETVEIRTGETIQRSVPLEPETSILKDIAADAIAVNHYVGRVTIDQAIHPTSFRDARGTAAGTTYEFQGFTNSNGVLPDDEIVRHTLAPRGLRVDAAYTRRNFGIVAMSLSYAVAPSDRRASFETAGGEEREVLGTVKGLRQLQLRPLQVTYRRFYKNFVPSLELGTGIAFQWLTVEGLRNDEAPPVTFSQTEAFWTLGLTGQYFFDANWFGVLRYSFQDYFNAGKGVEHVVSLGAGAAFPDIFGFAPEPPEEL